MIDMEIIEIKSHKELPKGIEFNYFEPPYMDKELDEISAQFQNKYGYIPETIYKQDSKYWVVK